MLIRILSVFLLIFTSATGFGFAFYKYEKGATNFEALGFIRAIAWISDNPEMEFLYDNKNDYGAGAIARLLVEGGSTENFSFELNVFELYNTSTASFNISSDRPQAEVERGQALTWSQRDGGKTQAYLTVDRANIRLSYDRIDLILGRQAVNLATAYYFTPNDFFAPFTAQTFYRVYKSGVDAARAEIRLGDLAQLTLLGVLGYEQDIESQSGWSNTVDQDRLSAIARVTATFFNVEWGLIGGQIRGADVIGASVQAEGPLKIGIRAEGHYLSGDDNGSVTEISSEIDRRFENSLTLTLAYFYHGAGGDSVDDYGLGSPGAYLARRYMALGASYEFSPLLTGQALLMENLVDESLLLSLYFVYSLSDETELSASLSIPSGEASSSMRLKSEFGIYPATLNMEIRSYF